MGTMATQSARRWRAVLFLCALSAAPSAVHAVACTSPDALCTGDPCVTRPVEVTSPCVLDFGTRTLVIGGTLRVPNGGTLSLTAGDIDVRRAIIGRHAKPFSGAGADIALAARGSLTVRWRIDASARASAGSIHLLALQDIRLLAPIRAATNGPQPAASGGVISVEAGGSLLASGRARIRAEGASGTAGGSVTLSGGRGVLLYNRVGAFGSDGGSIAVSSQAGDITVTQALSAAGTRGRGGSVALLALTGALQLLQRVDAEGQSDGGSIYAVADRAVNAYGDIRARGNLASGRGGTAVVASNGDVRLFEAVYADGADGGAITVVSTNGVVETIAPLLADGNAGVGGTVRASAGAAATIDSAIDADGDTRGGVITVSGGAVTIGNRGDLFARGDIGGAIMISGGAVVVEAGAKMLVDGDVPGGSIDLDATAGDLTLSGDFRARGEAGGRIRGSASRSLRATGAFAAAGDGCIGLMAGASLDVTGAEFDVPLALTCP